jgi:hypothetical protein
MVKILIFLSFLVLFAGISLSILGFINNNFSVAILGGLCVGSSIFNLYQINKRK